MLEGCSHRAALRDGSREAAGSGTAAGERGVAIAPRISANPCVVHRVEVSEVGTAEEVGRGEPSPYCKVCIILKIVLCQPTNQPIKK